MTYQNLRNTKIYINPIRPNSSSVYTLSGLYHFGISASIRKGYVLVFFSLIGKENLTKFLLKAAALRTAAAPCFHRILLPGGYPLYNPSVILHLPENDSSLSTREPWVP